MEGRAEEADIMGGRAEEAKKHGRQSRGGRETWEVHVECIGGRETQKVESRIVEYMKFESERRGRKHTVLGVVESPERW